MAEPARAADAREHQQLEPYPVTREVRDDAALTDHLLSPIWTGSKVWWILFALSGLLTLLFIFSATWTIAKGIGTWGNNIPVAWAFALTPAEKEADARERSDEQGGRGEVDHLRSVLTDRLLQGVERRQR